MNMTNEQSRQQPPPGTNRTQRPNGSVAHASAQDSSTNAEPPDTAILIQPPREPARRQEFWLDTCRGVAHVHSGCVQVQHLYRKHGCRFAEPTLAQVRGILDALDGAMPQWESNHPELFYQTLELSFPELVIHR
jgi:anaerobic selenocysteine-containing dehydrogenase